MSRSSLPEVPDVTGDERALAVRSARRARSPDDARSETGSREHRRAQTEPIAALVALFAVCGGLALYAGVAADATPSPEPDAAAPAMERLSSVAVEDGVVAPGDLPEPDAIVAGGREARITLSYDGRGREFGPEPPRGAVRASRPVSVRLRPGVRRPGRLVVEVWS